MIAAKDCGGGAVEEVTILLSLANGSKGVPEFSSINLHFFFPLNILFEVSNRIFSIY